MSTMKSGSGFALRTLLIAASAFAVTAIAANDGESWIGAWGAALHEPDLGVPGLANTGFTDQTLRQIIHTSVGGRHVRVRFSTFGAKGLVIGAAHVARRASGPTIVPDSDRILTFGGKTSITV